MDRLWSEECWSTFKYFIIITLIVSTCYIIAHKPDNKIFICRDMFEKVFKHSIIVPPPPGSSAVVRTSELVSGLKETAVERDTARSLDLEKFVACLNLRFCTFIASHLLYTGEPNTKSWKPRNVFIWPWLLGRPTKTSIGVARNPNVNLTCSLPNSNLEHYCCSSLLEPLSADKWVV